MRLGDDPKIRRSLGGGARSSSGYASRNGEAQGDLPPELVFDSFYDEKGHLKPALFYEAPEKLATLLKQAKLTTNALRQLYQGFRSFAAPLRDGRLDFDAAKERFGSFYVERVVYQTKRGVLPQLAKSFIDRHRELALSNQNEMLGLFRYLNNLLCYFDDKS